MFKGRRGGDCCAPVAADPIAAPCCPEPAPTCGGRGSKGLFTHLRSKHAARKAAKAARKANRCCAPDPCAQPCCAPAPAPEPCCAPAPEPCCAPAPAAAPCCGAAPVAMAAPAYSMAPAAAPCCGAGDVVYGDSMPTEAYSDGGAGSAYNEAGEQIVPGSTSVINDGAAGAGEPSPAVPNAPVAVPETDGI